MKVRYISTVALFALLVAASPAVAQQQDRRDVQLADKVTNAITQYTRYTVFDDLGGRVENGVVTLTGKVTMPYKRDDIEKRVAKIDGVKSVNNEITVLPVSIYDDQLRSRIARAIYGNPSFWTYATMANPPIHIIVENGRVTLTGVVLSQVDKLLAQSLATGRGEMGVTNALKTEM
ncbi:MAG TPA: BON domain-containing protein [Vicinamibacterales bacterium]|jgi:hyperosmotically inducible protein